MKFYQKITLSVILVIFLAVGFYFYFTRENKSMYCTQEAKLCPDGSYVGRTGPRCEFAKCPGENASDNNSGISGTALLGPTCPVERIPPDPQCADKPFKTTLAITTLDGTRVIKEFSSDAYGKFKVNLSPGDYMVRSATANILPRCTNNGTITVRTDAYTRVTIYCDTGIR